MIIRKYEDKDIEQITEIWNEIVESAIAFPEEEPLKLEDAREFFAKESAQMSIFIRASFTICSVFRKKFILRFSLWQELSAGALIE